MTVQIRPQGSDGPLYSPARDYAYCYPSMIEEIVKRFNDHRWPALEAMVEKEGVDFDQLCDAMDAYIRFLNASHENPQEKMPECMKRTGWMDVPDAAKIAIVAMLGTLCTGQMFHSIRTLSTPEQLQPEVAATAQLIGEAKRWYYARPWKRRFDLFVRRCFRGAGRLRRWRPWSS